MPRSLALSLVLLGLATAVAQAQPGWHCPSHEQFQVAVVPHDPVTGEVVGGLRLYLCINDHNVSHRLGDFLDWTGEVPVEEMELVSRRTYGYMFPLVPRAYTAYYHGYDGYERDSWQSIEPILHIEDIDGENYESMEVPLPVSAFLHCCFSNEQFIRYLDGEDMRHVLHVMLVRSPQRLRSTAPSSLLSLQR